MSISSLDVVCRMYPEKCVHRSTFELGFDTGEPRRSLKPKDGWPRVSSALCASERAPLEELHTISAEASGGGGEESGTYTHRCTLNRERCRVGEVSELHGRRRARLV